MANKKNMNKDYTVTGSLDGYGAVPPDYSNMSSGYGADTITIDLGGGAAEPIYTIDTMNNITLDSSMFTLGSTTVPYTYATTGTSGYTMTTNPSTVLIDADGLTMKEGADIIVGGKSLTQAIEKIEERLAILNPNPALEDRWEQLKELRVKYIELEKDLLEKEKIMKILKES
jgi:hypothetical protein